MNNDAFFAMNFAIAVVTLIIMSILAWMIIWAYKEIKNKFPVARKAYQRREGLSRLLANAERNNFKGKTLMLEHFLSTNENAAFEQRVSSQWHSIAKLKERLDEKYNSEFKIDIASRSCNISGDRCDIVFELTVAEPSDYAGTKFFMNFETTQIEVSNNKGRDLLKFKNVEENIHGYTIEDANGNECLEMTYAVNIIYPNDIPEDSAPVRAIFAAINESALDAIDYKSEKEFTRVYRIQSYNGELQLEAIRQETKVYSDEELDTYFAPITMRYQNELHKVSPSAAVELFSIALYNGENVFVRGIMGVGKSTLSQVVINRLSNRHDVIIVKISPTQIEELGSLTVKNWLMRQLSMYEGQRVIIDLDEAEKLLVQDEKGHSKANTFMLELLDGDFKKQTGCSTILTYNINNSEINPAIFRAGRCGVESEVTALTKDMANKAVKMLKNAMPDYIFHENRYNSLCDGANKDSQGREYCPKGFITIADLTKECFKLREYNTLLIAAIRNVSKGVIAPKKHEAPPTPSIPVLPTIPKAPTRKEIPPAVTNAIKEQLKKQ